jgi:hypothetical protein
MYLFGWHSKILLEISTCGEQRLVPIRGRYIIGTWSFGLELELAWFPMHFIEMPTYMIEQALLLFRRHGLSGSLDSLDEF